MGTCRNEGGVSVNCVLSEKKEAVCGLHSGSIRTTDAGCDADKTLNKINYFSQK